MLKTTRLFNKSALGKNKGNRLAFGRNNDNNKVNEFGNDGSGSKAS